jgi:hypothetical protein
MVLVMARNLAGKLSRETSNWCMLRATMRLFAGVVRISLAALLVAIIVAACASDDEEFFEIGDGRPDASLDTGIGTGTGGTSSFDSCQPDFCPVIGPGAPCCITPEGPCGMDTGLGCRTDEHDN